MDEAFRSGFVCLVGRPNVGKSTLLNRLVGRPISITAEKPQTTRNRILGVKHGPGWQVVYVDTPGIHAAQATLNRRMVRYATQALAEADLVLVLAEPGRAVQEDDRRVLDALRQAGTPAGARPAFLVLNKVDVAAEADVLAALGAFGALGLFAELVPISARTGRNVPRLEQLIEARLPPGPPYFEAEQITDQSEPALIAELVRQEVFRRTHQEVPYQSAVRVEAMHEQPGRLVVQAQILVERETQKGILIGKGGRMLKDIGTAARKNIEHLLRVPVYLELHVRLQARWSEDPRQLAALGYPDS